MKGEKKQKGKAYDRMIEEWIKIWRRETERMEKKEKEIIKTQK